MQTQATLHLIVNPAAGRGRGGRVHREVLKKAHDHGWHVNEYVTGGRGHATTIAAKLPDDEAPLLVLGGDGTMNEVINGLRHRSHPVGLVPIGTGNDFARLLRLRDTDDALHALREGKRRVVDTALVDVVNEDGTVERRRFINSMGIGFDAAVAVDVANVRLGSGMLPYLISVFRVLRTYEAVPSTITFSNVEISSTLFLACIGNGTTSGGGFRLTPHAHADDGLLDLCHVRSTPMRRILAVLPKALSGTHVHAPEVRMERAAHFNVALDFPLPVHLDGEILTRQARRLVVTCLPGVFEFFIPPDSALM
ncbi:MAG: diacylglycerol kinase family lipid kinase [Bacteroidia bacterium]|nr:diacylglycerol kinase family lipid kinase [Bacteroidia bacterium]